ncbi:unnamed protein product [Brassica rapa subsp. trilocularis]
MQAHMKTLGKPIIQRTWERMVSTFTLWAVSHRLGPDKKSK